MKFQAAAMRFDDGKGEGIVAIGGPLGHLTGEPVGPRFDFRSVEGVAFGRTWRMMALRPVAAARWSCVISSARC